MRVTCVSAGLDNGLTPKRHQAIIQSHTTFDEDHTIDRSVWLACLLTFVMDPTDPRWRVGHGHSELATVASRL